MPDSDSELLSRKCSIAIAVIIYRFTDLQVALSICRSEFPKKLNHGMPREMQVQALRLENGNSWLRSGSFLIWQRICWMWNSSQEFRRWRLLALDPKFVDRNASGYTHVVSTCISGFGIRADQIESGDHPSARRPYHGRGILEGASFRIGFCYCAAEGAEGCCAGCCECRYVLLSLRVFD